MEKRIRAGSVLVNWFIRASCARLCARSCALYRSGVTVLDAIKTCEEVVDNKYISDGLARAGQQIAAGESLTETFRNLGMFPPLVIRMLRVGESTGALDSALMNITYFYNRDVRESVDKALDYCRKQGLKVDPIEMNVVEP